MNQKGHVARTTSKYIFALFSIPFGLAALGIISLAFSPELSKIFFALTFLSIFIVAFGTFIIQLAFGKRIKRKRREMALQNLAAGRKTYFSDLEDEARKYSWEIAEIDRELIRLKGEERGIGFTILAELKKAGKSKAEFIEITCQTKPGPEIKFTSGIFAEFLEKNKIGKPKISDAFTAIGENSEKNIGFAQTAKPQLEFLFGTNQWLSELEFKGGTMLATVISDTDENGETKIRELAQKLAELAEIYNQTF